MPTLKRIYKFLYTVYFKFLEHNGFLLSAGIAFFIFFSLFPFLILLAIVIGYVIEGPELQKEILGGIFGNIPAIAQYVQTDVIKPLISHRPIAGIIAGFGLLWAGLGFFGGLAAGLNAVFEVKETRHYLFIRAWAFVVSMMMLTLLIVSILASSFASTLRDQVFAFLFPAQVATLAWIAVTALIGFVSTMLLFLITYRLVPNVRIPFRYLWLGTLVAGTTWEIGKYGFAIYLNLFASKSYGLIYGSLASIVLLMFWLYISAVLLLLGQK